MTHQQLNDKSSSVSRPHSVPEQEGVADEKTSGRDGQPQNPSSSSDSAKNEGFVIMGQPPGELGDLDDAIARQRDAVDRIPQDHPDKPISLYNLADSFRARYERLRELNDLEQAILRYRDALELVPDGHPEKHAYTNNLALAHWDRFQRVGNVDDLNQSISKYKDAINLVPGGHPDKPGCLRNLGDSFRARYTRLGELSDLEQAILTYKDAIALTPTGHPQRFACLWSLNVSFRARFKRLNERSDFDQAILIYRDAVDLIPDGNPQKPILLSGLGTAFSDRFKLFGELGDLDQAISRYKDVVGLIPDAWHGKNHVLSGLADSLRLRYGRLGELDDLEHAISTYQAALDLTPHRHSSRSDYLNNLGTSFFSRFRRLGQLSDLEHAVSRYRDAVQLTPDEQPRKPGYINNLAAALSDRFWRLGELGDLEQAISRYRDAISIAPDGHPDKPGCVGGLGVALTDRFGRLGELGDLEQAIRMCRRAVELTPDGHSDKPGYLSNLGNAFEERFMRLGELSDLEQAIRGHKDAVDLTPDGNPDKPGRLKNLGNSLLTRFDRLGELSDLEQAIPRFRMALGLIPNGHPDRPVDALGSSFRFRFGRLGELDDLEEAISGHRDAVDLTPDDHPRKPGRLNNLGACLLDRFRRLRELSDVEKAIPMFRNVVDLTPDGHHDKPQHLMNLGAAFRARFHHLGELNDLEQAISKQRDAIDLVPDGHHYKPSCLNNLGDSFKARFQRLGKVSDLEQASSLYSRAACASTGIITHRLHASRQWISCARVLRHHSLLQAYSVAIGLLPQLAWIGFSLTHRYSELVKGADIVREAAAAALDLGQLETAVEWLEQGRSIVWGELFQLRSSYDELSAAHPSHARRLRELSTALEHASTSHERSLASPRRQSAHAERYATETLEKETNRHRTLAIGRDELLKEIRGFPGFERFLLHREFSQLCASAHSGPVVMLNAAGSRCDALIVRADAERVTHVPLPDFTLGQSHGLQNALKVLLGHARDVPEDDREGSREQRRGVDWEFVLSVLWSSIVKPVLDALGFSTPGDLSRIFWCPTGPFSFLPIHAAGLYGPRFSSPGHKLSDFVVSSYVPTLSILAPSPKLDRPSEGPLRLLSVPQPSSDGQFRLPGVETELKYIRNIIRSSPSTPRPIHLESTVGTVEEVLSLMQKADWVHFACHGVQDAANPTSSGLCLADQRRLKLSDMIALSLPRGGLAFLSACQTATGNKDLSDEAIHVAAGMLFAGYGGVVGTMWSISDRVAPLVARDVYERLFRGGARPDWRLAARAVHGAVGRLREGGRASFHEWLPFIHVGL